MNKRLISTLLACLMCFSVLFSGCAEESGNENANANNGNNEQVSTDVAGKLDSAVSDKVEDVISDVVNKFQPSSNLVVELAEKNELSDTQIRNYRDFLLYVNQNDETLKVIRDELAPGRGEDLPLDILFDINSNIAEHYTYYFNTGYYNGGSSEYLKKYVYFRDSFTFDNALDVDLYYVNPDLIESAYDYFMKVIYAVNDDLVEEDIDDIFRIVDYAKTIFKHNTLLSLKDIFVRSKYTIVPLCDDFLLRYNSDGELERMYIFVNDVLVDIGFYDYGYIPFAEKINNIKSGWLTTLLNDKTAAAEAGKALATAIEAAEKLG